MWWYDNAISALWTSTCCLVSLVEKERKSATAKKETPNEFYAYRWQVVKPLSIEDTQCELQMTEYRNEEENKSNWDRDRGREREGERSWIFELLHTHLLGECDKTLSNSCAKSVTKSPFNQVYRVPFFALSSLPSHHSICLCVCVFCVLFVSRMKITGKLRTQTQNCC